MHARENEKKSKLRKAISLFAASTQIQCTYNVRKFCENPQTSTKKFGAHDILRIISSTGCIRELH